MTGDAVRQLRREVAHLNGMLGAGLLLAVAADERNGIDRHGAAGGTGQRPVGTAVVTLAVTRRSGLHREASRRLRLTPGHRSRLLALSECLAECAMDLGLGVSVCRTERSETP